MIQYGQGNLLEADAEALVNTVNCHGVMGKGIALQFKQAFPDNFKEYLAACQAGRVRLGEMFIVDTGRLVPRYIINFPTKDHWKSKSRIEDIQTGLTALIDEVRRLKVRSIAIPPLGCGNGGLQWVQVKPLIESAFKALPDVEAIVFEPHGAPVADAMPVATSRPRLTRVRALIIKLLEIYGIADYRLSRLEVQKLAYLLQAAGERLELRFVQHKYGPYSDQLNHVLERLEGHYLRGYGDRSSQSEIYLVPGATEEAESILNAIPDAQEHLKRVSELIKGFETPYGMELLATIHWVAQEDPEVAVNADLAVVKVQQWSERKRELFKPAHIYKAWQRLREQNWFPDATSGQTLS